MELVIAIAIIGVGLIWYYNDKIKNPVVSNKKEEDQAPYKVEAPQVDAKASTQVKCGCGRSPSGFCVGLHSLTAEEWATHADNPNKTVAAKAPAKAPAKKKPAAMKATGGKKAAAKPKAVKAVKATKAKKV